MELLKIELEKGHNFLKYGRKGKLNEKKNLKLICFSINFLLKMQNIMIFF